MIHGLRRQGDSASIDVIDSAEIATLVAEEQRPRPRGRPWVAVNMVTSVDGAITVDGVSGSLGGDADREVFRALRAMTDVILAGSGTVTAERYRPPSLPPSRRDERMARGQAAVPRLAVVSNRGDVDLGLPMFGDADDETRPVVLVAAGAITDARRTALEEVADVVPTGDERVDLEAALAQLGEVPGVDRVLCEGGAVLNGVLAAHDLIDEWCITLGPALVGGGASRAVTGPTLDAPLVLHLDRLWLADDELLLRYLRDRSADG
ncbi:MAG: dihydrofolate reductase family protein [Acidimicrobiales bacterium]